MSRIIYHGHSFLEIESNETVILIDPFMKGNPFCQKNPETIKCSYIILTHAHTDHFGDTVEIAKSNGATVIAMVEICEYLYKKHNEVKFHEMNIGGAMNFPFGKVKFTIAHHSSNNPDGTYAGTPAGILLKLGDKTIYHAGDTALFYDMKLIGEMNKINYAFLPIGDNYTMGVDDAVKAAEFINAEVTVPIHYNTFDLIKADDQDFKKKVESIGKKCKIMRAGDEVIL